MTAMPSVSKLVERSAGVCRHQGMGKIQAYLTVAIAARDAKALLLEYGWTDVAWLDEVEHLAAYRAAAVSGWVDSREPESSSESAMSEQTLPQPTLGRQPPQPRPLSPEHSLHACSHVMSDEPLGVA